MRLYSSAADSNNLHCSAPPSFTSSRHGPTPGISNGLHPSQAVSTHLQPSPAISSRPTHLPPSPAVSRHPQPSPDICSRLRPSAAARSRSQSSSAVRSGLQSSLFVSSRLRSGAAARSGPGGRRHRAWVDADAGGRWSPSSETRHPTAGGTVRRGTEHRARRSHGQDSLIGGCLVSEVQLNGAFERGDRTGTGMVTDIPDKKMFSSRSYVLPRSNTFIKRFA